MGSVVDYRVKAFSRLPETSTHGAAAHGDSCGGSGNHTGDDASDEADGFGREERGASKGGPDVPAATFRKRVSRAYARLRFLLGGQNVH